MIRKKFILNLVFIFMLSLCLRCLAVTQSQLTGTFILVQGDYALFSLGLPNKVLKVIYYPPRGGAIELSKVDSENFLFNLISYGDDPDEIWMMNLQTGLANKLGNGSYPFYMKSHNILFFSKDIGNSFSINRDMTLYYCNMDDFGKIKNDADLRKFARPVTNYSPQAFYTNLLAISLNEVIFYKYIRNKERIFKYNIDTEELILLPLKGCSQFYFYRPDSRQLLCFNRKYGLYLTGFDGKNITPLPSYLRDYQPITYIKSTDQVLFVTTLNTLGLYSFKTKEFNKLNIKKGLDIAGNALYFK